MKKPVLFLVIALASTAAFAGGEFDLLANAFYKGAASDFTTDQIGLDSFYPGAEMRIKLGLIRLDAGMIARMGVDGDARFLMPLDAGLSLDLLFLRVGAGVGTQFAFSGEGGMQQVGYNVKASADLLLGGLDLGLVAYQFRDSFGVIFADGALSDLDNWLVGATLGFRIR